MLYELYDFQRAAVDQMRNKPGFLLADEMGLGKTVTAICEAHEAGARTVLIVCPKSVIGVWENHLKDWWPQTEVFTMDCTPTERKKRWQLYDIVTCPKVVIVSWAALSINADIYKHQWDWLIADEAHMAKNRKAKRTVQLKKIRAAHRRALTGTPIINRPDELWSLLNFLYPKRYTSYWKWFDAFVAYEVDYGYRKILGSKNVPRLQKEIEPIFLQRTKEEVLPQLPAKYYSRIPVALSPKQRAAYNSLKKEGLTLLDNGGIVDAPTILAQLVRLRQLTVSYAEANGDGKVRMSEPSTKLDALADILAGTDKPVVVFTQYKQAVHLAAKRFPESALLTGDTPQKSRQFVVNQFQNGNIPVLLCTMQTAGVGITLTAADTCVFLDRAWSPAENAQAEDRLHRVGQKSAVNVIILEAPNTIDQDVEGVLWRKAEWLREVLGRSD